MIASALRLLRLVSFAWSLSHDLPASLDVARDATEASSDEWVQRWLVGWSFYESRWDARAADPTSTTFGAMQIDPRIWSAVPEERDAQFIQAVEALDVLTFSCGTRRRALDGYSSGKCDLRTNLVTARCAVIGGCE